MSFEKHRRFLATLAAGDVPAELAEWYVNAYRQHINTGQALDVCLGLRGPGVRLPATRERLELRNALLLQALAEIEAENVWQKCDILAHYVKRWPRSRHEAPFLEPVFELGAKIPETANGIYAAIGKPATK